MKNLLECNNLKEEGEETPKKKQLGTFEILNEIEESNRKPGLINFFMKSYRKI